MTNICLRDGLGRISTLSKNSAGTNITKLKYITKIHLYPKVQIYQKYIASCEDF